MKTRISFSHGRDRREEYRAHVTAMLAKGVRPHFYRDWLDLTEVLEGARPSRSIRISKRVARIAKKPKLCLTNAMSRQTGLVTYGIFAYTGSGRTAEIQSLVEALPEDMPLKDAQKRLRELQGK